MTFHEALVFWGTGVLVVLVAVGVVAFLGVLVEAILDWRDGVRW